LRYWKKRGYFMQTIKVMSIIGIVVFSMAFLGIAAWLPEDSSSYSMVDIENAEAGLGLGLLATMYGIAFAITCLVQSKKTKTD